MIGRGRNDEPRRYRQPEAQHLSQVFAFTSNKFDLILLNITQPADELTHRLYLLLHSYLPQLINQPINNRTRRTSEVVIRTAGWIPRSLPVAPGYIAIVADHL